MTDQNGREIGIALGREHRSGVPGGPDDQPREPLLQAEPERIARWASLVDPDVLVLDEATSSVDALTEVRIARALDKLASGRTTIAIAHRLSTAARADRVLVLQRGRLVEDGAHADLVNAGGAYAAMYDAWVASTSGA